MFKRNPAKALKNVLGDYALPSFPAVVMRVLQRIRDADASVDSVTECLALDPGLSVRILATVNTAAYAPRTQVKNLAQAVAMLGMSAVESIVMAIAVSDALPRPECTGFDRRRFWRAAARRASTARSFARVLHPATGAATFTAALLQDMAVPLLAASRAKDYGPVLESWHRAESRHLHELEHVALGTDHAEVATWLCETWQLPTSLADAIGHHHIDGAAASACPPAVLLVAPLREQDSAKEIDALVARAEDSFGLRADTVTDIVRSGLDEAEELAGLFA